MRLACGRGGAACARAAAPRQVHSAGPCQAAAGAGSCRLRALRRRRQGALRCFGARRGPHPAADAGASAAAGCAAAGGCSTGAGAAGAGDSGRFSSGRLSGPVPAWARGTTRAARARAAPPARVRGWDSHSAPTVGLAQRMLTFRTHHHHSVAGGARLGFIAACASASSRAPSCSARPNGTTKGHYMSNAHRLAPARGWRAASLCGRLTRAALVRGGAMQQRGTALVAQQFELLNYSMESLCLGKGDIAQPTHATSAERTVGCAAAGPGRAARSAASRPCRLQRMLRSPSLAAELCRIQACCEHRCYRG